MKTPEAFLNNLPELPVELFELGGRFDFSRTAPVLTNHPDAVTVDRQPVALPAPNKSSTQTKTYYGWVAYPKVSCYPMPEPVAYSAMELDHSKPDLGALETDLGAIAGARRYYKLTDFRDLGTTFCEVRYGPWFVTVTERESCSDAVPNEWVLDSPDPGIALSWLGTWADMPPVPNLIVWVNLNDVVKVGYECCAGYKQCPGSLGCVPDAVTCQGSQPV